MTEQTPTDQELDALCVEISDYDDPACFRHMARAVLAKFGNQPAGAGEPHAELQQAWVPGHKWEWTNANHQRWFPHNGEPEWDPDWQYRLATPQPTQAQAGAVPLTPEQCNDLLAASFCVASVGDPTATMKSNDAERIITLLHDLGGITTEGASHDTERTNRRTGKEARSNQLPKPS